MSKSLPLQAKAKVCDKDLTNFLSETVMSQTYIYAFFFYIFNCYLFIFYSGISVACKATQSLSEKLKILGFPSKTGICSP